MTPLEKVFARPDLAAVCRMTDWSLTRDGDLVTFEVTARDDERYRVHLKCDAYPNAPPSAQFVNEQGSRSDPRAWPHGDGAFLQVVKPPPNCFLCMPLTREGLQYHPEWRTQNVNAWDSGRHTLLDLLNYIQRLLNSPGYQRRGP